MDSPNSRLLRGSRWSQHHCVYLCTANVHDRLPVFLDLFTGRLVVRALQFSDTQGWTSTHAYSLMPDHLHWMFELTGSKALSEVMASVKRQSARAINQRLGQKGTFWQDGFHDHAIRREESLEKIFWYVVLNPVRAGLVDSIDNYPLWDGRWI